ncbi:MAG: hypothetical protein K9K34_19340 [Desulfarculaceae bacterium]|nr:hypothetical protein [Desulfarculaceae bacterium]
MNKDERKYGHEDIEINETMDEEEDELIEIITLSNYLMSIDKVYEFKIMLKLGILHFGCNDTFINTTTALKNLGIKNFRSVIKVFKDNGGLCDCKILVHFFHDEIFGELHK